MQLWWPVSKRSWIKTLNRTVEFLTLAIDALTAAPEVIHSDKEFAVVSIVKVNQLLDYLYKKYKILPSNLSLELWPGWTSYDTNT